MNRWIEALERSLEVEDVGLNHEATRIEIARYYIQRQDYGKALLYAGPAAESWAGWAMTWAAYCHEALKHWDEAEMWERRQTERPSGLRLAGLVLLLQTDRARRPRQRPPVRPRPHRPARRSPLRNRPPDHRQFSS